MLNLISACVTQSNYCTNISYNADEDDARITNETTQTIDPESDMACVTIEAVDDQIVGGIEFFNLTVTTNNTLDVVNGTTDITIEDNDGVFVDQYF